MKYKMVIFGLNGVIVNGSLARVLLQKVYSGEELKQLFSVVMQEFHKFLQDPHYPFVDRGLDHWLYSHFKGMKYDEVLEIAKNIPLMEGAQEMVDKLKERGYKLAIISDAFTLISDIQKERFGFDYSYANELIVRNGVLTGWVNAPYTCPNPGEGCMEHFLCKPLVLKVLTEREGISNQEIIAVGDGYSDKCLFELVGLRIGYKPYDLVEMHKNSRGGISLENLIDEFIWDGGLERIPQVIEKWERL